MQDWKKWFEKKVTEATDSAWSLLKDPRLNGPVYFWFQQGHLMAALDKPSGEGEYQLLTSERCPTDLEKHQLRAWLHELCRWIPIIPERFNV